MPLESGTQLGHYEITDPIGKGGMGEVYRALDTKLGREVAIKVLPSELAQDAERLARLEREARMLAALNHPNIAAIHGLEESGDTRFLVLELVEGETLADRLERGAIPIEESLKLALQIAEALEAAHDKGVIHRDLKPANIKVTPEGRVKVLDFGLAKAFIGDQADVNLSNSPTLSMAATQAGIVLGTAGYMSPEQAGGEVADHRADIWAFGVVLFEMLTGKGLFGGKTVTHVLASVMKDEPSWSLLPPALHPRVRFLLERCLEKEARDRCQSIGEARADIQRALADSPRAALATGSATQATPAASRLPWVAAAVIGVLALAAGWILKPAPETEPGLVARFPFVLPEGQTFANGLVRMLDVAADGSKFVYAANGQVFLRDLDDTVSTPIRGTAGAAMPTLSPDGQELAYLGVADFAILKVPLVGGTPLTLRPGSAEPSLSLSWEAGGELLFTMSDGIWSVPSNGGEPRLVAAAEGGESLANPRRLPDDAGILFVSSADGNWDAGRIYIQRGDTRTLVYEGGSDARYVPTGHIIFAQGTTLFGFPFDLDRLERLGGPVPLSIEDLTRSSASDTGQYAVSDNGTLVQIPGGGVVFGPRSLVWVDRQGNRQAIAAPEDDYVMARISPDGGRVALTVGSPEEIWILDLATGSRSNLTRNAATSDRQPVWTPDGERIFFFSDRDERPGIYVISADGGTAEFVAGSDEFIPLPWTMIDEETLAVVSVYGAARVGISLLSIDDGGDFDVRLSGNPMESEPGFSPDRRWVAYQWVGGDPPGIYFRPFPDMDRTFIPGPPAAYHPVFSRDGSELFYFNQANPGIEAVGISDAPGLSIGTPERLFSGAYWYGAAGPSGQNGRAWDLDPETGRFLMLALDDATDDSEASEPRINVVLNWFTELRERVPVP